MEKQKKELERRKRPTKGITLIALVITIVILIILAVISMSAIFGENGILDRLEDAKAIDAAAKLEEELKLKLLETQLDAFTGEHIDIDAIFGDRIKGLYSITEHWSEEKRINRYT